MSRLRQAIARRLKEAHIAAMLTTFNEVDMGAVMALRNDTRPREKHGVRFVQSFAKAAIAALKELPAVNAEIHGDEVIYKNYYDIGVAVGTPQGWSCRWFATPINFPCRDRENHGELGLKARDGKLTLADMSGGTFTISNGGVVWL